MADAGLRMVVEGEKEFKAAIADINAQMKLLGSEMKLATSEFDKNEKSVESLTARNNVLTKEIDAQKSKVETLKAALKSSADTYGENDEKTQKWAIQLNNAQAELNGMERELAANAKEAEELGENIEDSGDKAEKSGPKWEKLGSVLKGIGAGIAAIGTAAVAAGKGLWDVANDTAAAGDEIDKMSQKIGISAEAYQEWAYVFERSGTDVNNLQAGMKTLSTVIADAATGSESAAEKLSAVGLSIEDLNGLTQEQQLEMVVSALQDMGSGAERTAAATDLLGKSATDMAAVLNMTAEDTAALRQEAEDYGMVMSDEAVAASAAFEDSLSRLKDTLSGTKNGIVGEVLPSITQLMDGIADLVAGNENAAQEIEDGVNGLISSVSDMIPQALDLLMTIIDGVADAAPQIISTLVTGIVEVLPELADAAIEVIGALVDGVIDALPALIDAAVSIITKLCEMLGDPVQLGKVLDAALEIVMAIVGGLIDNVDELIDAAFTLIDGLIEFLTEPGNLEKLVLTAIELTLKIGEGLIKAIPQLLTSVVKLITNIKDTFTKTDWKSIGKNIVDGLLNGLKNAWHSLTSWFDNAWDNLVGGVKDLLGIHSPSTVFAGIGKNMGLGLEEGFVDTMSDAERAMRNAIPSDFGVHGDFTASGAAMGGNVYNITIDAANVREFNDIVRIAQGARQSRRLGYVGG